MTYRDRGAGLRARFLSDNLQLGSATLLSGVFNYFYVVLLAHHLGPARYGDVTALNNLAGLFLLPAPVVGLWATRTGKGSKGWTLESLGAGFVVWALAFILSAPLGAFFHVPGWDIVVFASGALWDFSWVINVGYLQRARRYGWVGILTAAGAALPVGAVYLALASRHVLLVLGLLQALGIVLLWALSVGMVQRLAPLAESSRPSRPVLTVTWGIGVVQAMMGLADGLLAKSRLGLVDAGLYNGLVTIGQTVPYLAASMATVMLTASLDRPEDSKRYLSWTLAAAGVLIAFFFIVVSFWPDRLIDMVLGPSFLSLRPWLTTYGAAMALMALLEIFLIYGVVEGLPGVLWVAATGLLLWVGWLLYAHHIGALVWSTLGSMAWMATATGLLVWRHAKGLPPRRRCPAGSD